MDRQFAYCLRENLLSDLAVENLMTFVEANETRFTAATVSTGSREFRQASILYDFAPFDEMVKNRVRAMLPSLMDQLDVDPFPVGDIECQLTQHGNANYFRPHNDNGSPDTATRVLTYVYYFHRLPKRFSGGELRVYHSAPGEAREFAVPAADISPAANSIIFFESFRYHEVMPVICPSGRFPDGRFTINGWIRRASSPV